MGGSEGWVMGRWDEGRRFGGWEIGNCIAPGSVYMAFGVGHGRHWFGIRYKLLQHEMLLEKRTCVAQITLTLTWYIKDANACS